MNIRFSVPGEPRGKGRPRFRRAGGYVRTYTPQDTADYEDLVKWHYRASNNWQFGKDEPIRLVVTAYFAIPKSASKARRQLMEKGEIRPTKKPDTDNIIKIIADALNGIAYRDDAQIVEARAAKYYAETPRVEVEIEDYDRKDDIRCVFKDENRHCSGERV